MAAIRQRLTVTKKREILGKINAGWTQAAVASFYKMPKRTISDIYQSREKILNPSVRGELLSIQKDTDFHALSRSVYNELVLLFKFGLFIPNTGIKGLGFAHSLALGMNSFRASNGWALNLRRKYKITGITSIEDTHHFTFDVDEKEIRYLKDIHRLITDSKVAAEDIYSMAETVFFYNCLPLDSLDYTSSRSIDKHDRVSMLLCCNASGSKKERVRFIGLASHVRAVAEAMDPANASQFMEQERGHMDKHLFNEWLVQFDQRLTRRSLLLIEDTQTYELMQTTQLHNVQLLRLPPAMLCKIHPFEFGITQVIKAHYRRMTMERIVDAATKTPMIHDPRTTDAHVEKLITLADSVALINHVWGNISEEIIKVCWKECCILPPHLRQVLPFTNTVCHMSFIFPPVSGVESIGKSTLPNKFVRISEYLGVLPAIESGVSFRNKYPNYQGHSLSMPSLSYLPPVQQLIMDESSQPPSSEILPDYQDTPAPFTGNPKRKANNHHPDQPSQTAQSPISNHHNDSRESPLNDPIAAVYTAHPPLELPLPIPLSFAGPDSLEEAHSEVRAKFLELKEKLHLLSPKERAEVVCRWLPILLTGDE